MNGAIFRTYVERCLAPTLRPGDVVILDNLPAHKVAGVRRATAASATFQSSSSIRRTIRSRPCGVRRAFLWIFIQGPPGPQLIGCRNHSFPVLPWMNNLHSFHS